MAPHVQQAEETAAAKEMAAKMAQDAAASFSVPLAASSYSDAAAMKERKECLVVHLFEASVEGRCDDVPGLRCRLLSGR